MKKEKISPLTFSEIAVLKDVFISILDRIHPINAEELSPEVKQFIQEVNLRNLAYTFRPDALESLNDDIFDSLPITEYVFELTIRLFFEIGDNDSYVERLALTIANSLQIDGPDIALSTIPESVAENCVTNLFSFARKESIFDDIKALFIKELTPKEKLQKVLVSNKHLMIVYLIQLI